MNEVLCHLWRFPTILNRGRSTLLKTWSTDDYLWENYTTTMQNDPVLTNSHDTRSYRAFESQCDYILERHLWVIIQKIVSYYQMIFLFCYPLWRHQVPISMLYTCCVDMATDTTSCPCRQNQATFGSFAACTLPIAGDFEYIWAKPATSRIM